MTDDERRAELTEQILKDVAGLWKHHDDISILTERQAAGIVSGAMQHYVAWQQGHPPARPFTTVDMMNLVTALLSLVRELTLDADKTPN